MCLLRSFLENGIFTAPFVLTHSLIKWDDSSSNYPFYPLGFFCVMTRLCSLVLVHPCRIHNSFPALSRCCCRRCCPFRLPELLLGDCPKGWLLPRQPSIHCCSNGVIFFALYVGRLGRWATNGNVYLCETRSPVLALHLYVILLVFLSMRQKLFLWVAPCDVGLVLFCFGCCVARGYFRISPSGLCP